MNLKAKFLCVVSLCLGLVACQKEDQTVGMGMLEPSDIITTHVDSTSTIISLQTEKDDTIRSTTITYMVGENYDDVFGKSRASYATRLYLKAMIGNLEGFRFDSACFQIAKSKTYFYGDTTVAQELSLYELNQAITVDDCKQYQQKGIVPASISAKTKVCDITIPAYKDTASLRSFKLNNEYGSNLYSKLKECYNIDSSLQYIDSLFLKKFNGIYVTTEDDCFSNTKATITHCVPGIVFYLSGKDTTVTLTLAPSPQAYDKPLTSDPSQIYLQAINVFEHDYSGASVEFGSVSEQAYVQGFMGTKAKLTFSNLEEWRACVDLNTPSDSAVVINSAKLRLPLLARTTWNEYLPLTLRIYDSSRKLMYSTVSTTTDSTNFEFNMQNFLVTLYNKPAKADTYSYEIAVPENNTYGNAFVIDGSQAEKMKLIITYTK